MTTEKYTQLVLILAASVKEFMPFTRWKFLTIKKLEEFPMCDINEVCLCVFVFLLLHICWLKLARGRLVNNFGHGGSQRGVI